MPFGVDKPDDTWLGPSDTVYPPESGNYSNPKGWTSQTVPDENYDVVLPRNNHPYTVTRTIATPAVYRLTIGTGATLKSYAPLQVDDYIQVDGALNFIGSLTSSFLYGAGTVAGRGTISSYIGAAHTGPGIVPTSLGLKAVGGTIELDSPQAFRSQLGGMLSGSGTIDFHSGAFVFHAGTRATVANLVVSGAQVSLTQDFRYGGHFSLTGGTLSLVDGLTLEHGSLVLSGQTTLAAGTIQGFGAESAQDPVVYLRGSTTVAGGTLLEDAVVKNFGHVSALGDLTLSDSTFVNLKGSTYEFDGDGSVLVASGHGGTFVNNGSVVRVGGSSFSEIDATYVNNGGTQVSTGQLVFDQAVTGKGAFAIDNDSQLWFEASVGSGQQVIFGSVGNGTLIPLDVADFHATIAGFHAGDAIDLKGYPSDHDSMSYKENADGTGGVLTIDTIANQTATFAFSGHYEASGFHTGPNAYNGTLLTYTVPDHSLHA